MTRTVDNRAGGGGTVLYGRRGEEGVGQQLMRGRGPGGTHLRPVIELVSLMLAATPIPIPPLVSPWYPASYERGRSTAYR